MWAHGRPELALRAVACARRGALAALRAHTGARGARGALEELCSTWTVWVREGTDDALLDALAAGAGDRAVDGGAGGHPGGPGGTAQGGWVRTKATRTKRRINAAPDAVCTNGHFHDVCAVRARLDDCLAKTPDVPEVSLLARKQVIHNHA